MIHTEASVSVGLIQWLNSASIQQTCYNGIFVHVLQPAQGFVFYQCNKSDTEGTAVLHLFFQPQKNPLHWLKGTWLKKYFTAGTSLKKLENRWSNQAVD